MSSLKPNTKSTHERTFDRVTKIINEELNGRTLWEVPGPNGGFLRGYSLHGAVVIVHFYEDGGCSHYVAGHGNTWDAMETQLHQIAAEAV